MRLEITSMTDSEINEVVTKVLRNRLNQFGFARSRVLSDLDFDSSPIIRVVARYENGHVPTDKLIDSLEDIRSELIERGEERFVFLDSEYPDEEEDDEETE